jgi:hypothetical protein
LPSRPRPYGTTEKLFAGIKQMVAQYAPVSEAASELLTFWILSTWLGSCVFDAPELQERLIALLTPYECQQTAERADSFEGLTIEAVLTLCHVGKTQAYAREIADEVNRIQEQRGEALRLSPAKVGHKLKKLGLFSRRLDQGGNGLILDLATRERVHQAAATYIGDDWAKNGEASGCPLCQPKETEDPIL